MPFENLFIHLGTPLLAWCLVSQFEARFFIQMPCRVEPFKCGQIHLRVGARKAKTKSLFEQLVAHTRTPHGIGGHEPAQMGALGFGMNAINGNRAVNFLGLIVNGEPQTVL